MGKNPIERMAAAHQESPFPIWRTIRIGGMDKGQLLAAIEAAGMRVTDVARDMMNQAAFTTAVESVEVPLVRVTLPELGFKGGPFSEQKPLIEEIYHRAEVLGLKRCRPEVGPHLRLAYADQPVNEWYLIGMDSIDNSIPYPHSFVVGHGPNGQWLWNNDAWPGNRVHLSNPFELINPFVFEVASE